jgi:hypothetical protein
MSMDCLLYGLTVALQTGQKALNATGLQGSLFLRLSSMHAYQPQMVIKCISLITFRT